MRENSSNAIVQTKVQLPCGALTCNGLCALLKIGGWAALLFREAIEPEPTRREPRRLNSLNAARFEQLTIARSISSTIWGAVNPRAGRRRPVRSISSSLKQRRKQNGTRRCVYVPAYLLFIAPERGRRAYDMPTTRVSEGVFDAPTLRNANTL